MGKEIFKQLRKELLSIGIIFIASLIAFKIIFFREGFFVVLRTVLAIFWLFVLPGFFAMLYWIEELRFFERLVIGIALGTSVIGIASYYLGLSGLHVRYHAFLLPLIMAAIGLVIAFGRKRTQKAGN